MPGQMALTFLSGYPINLLTRQQIYGRSYRNFSGGDDDGYLCEEAETQDSGGATRGS